MGGKVAMQFAANYPENVEKLIVVDIAPKAYPPTHRCLLAALRALDLKGFRSFAVIDTAIAPLIADPTVRRFVLKSLIRDPPAGFRWKIGLDAILQNYDELTRPVVLKQPFCNPVCFIRGALSNHIEEHDLPMIRKMFPQAELVDIPDAGHWVHAEAPEEFFLAVVKFLHGRS
jgi:pimeloyl-ACP methyl ester carboxylesterase